MSKQHTIRGIKVCNCPSSGHIRSTDALDTFRKSAAGSANCLYCSRPFTEHAAPAYKCRG